MSINIQPFESALGRFLAQIDADNRVDGVLVSGSYVAGTVGPYSDLDLYLLFSSDSSSLARWEVISIEGIELELTRHTFEEYESIIREGKHIKEIVFPLSMGRLLLDKRQRFGELVALAASKIKECSRFAPPDADARESISRALCFRYRKVGKALANDDANAFEYEIGFNMHMVPTLMLNASGHRITPDPLRQFKEALPAIYASFCRCLGATSTSERWQRYQELMQQAFAELSLGRLPQPLGPTKEC